MNAFARWLDRSPLAAALLCLFTIAVLQILCAPLDASRAAPATSPATPWSASPQVGAAHLN